MKIDAKELLAACEALVGVATTKSVNPIHSFFRLSSECMEANDERSYKSVRIIGDGAIDPCCVNAATFHAMAQRATGEVELERGDGYITISAGWKARLGTLPAADFPSYEPELTKIGVNGEDIATGIEAVSWAVLPQKHSMVAEIPVLVAVGISIKKDTLECLACNRKTIARFERKVIGAEFSVNIPQEFCDELGAALRQPGSVLSVNPSWVGVEYDGGSYRCLQQEGKWPALDMMLPDANVRIGEIDREEFIGHLKACQVVNPKSDDNYATASIDFRKNGASIGTATKTGSEYKGGVLGTFEPVKLHFVIHHLIEALSNCDSNKLVLMQDELGPSHRIRFQDGDTTVGMAGINP